MSRETEKHLPYSIRWKLNITQINYYSILYFNIHSIKKYLYNVYYIQYLVYVNRSNQRTTPKEITTVFPLSDISPRWIGMARDIPAPNRKGSAPRQCVDRELTRQFPTYATSAAFFFPNDFRCSFVGDTPSQGKLQDVFGGRSLTTLVHGKSRFGNMCTCKLQ